MEDTQVSTPEERRVIVPKKGSALRKLAEDDSSRKKFLKMVGGAGAASAFAVLLAACGEDEETTTSGGGDTTAEDDSAGASKDLDILNYALTLEFLEAKFYQDVLNSDVKPPSQAIAETITTFGEHEQEHVDAITATIEMMGGTPVEDPNGNFESVLKDAETILATAARVENVGAAAYLNEAADIQSPEVLAAALSIHTVEARHAAALNDVAGLDFTGGDQFEGSIPDGPFAKPADRDTVMAEIKPFLPSGGGGN
ncbi:MAG: ferritin-like domain-containing protein [Thermoleophilaceae bacterium]|nr:ferritin-like domain-containing protein [Thermoleophilaceae bacterium]